VNATDEKGVSATATFKVIVLVININTRATEYMQGDTVSIYASCSDAQTGVKLKITDPANSVFWTTTVDVKTKVGDWYVLESYVTVLLPSDASLGNWNFTASDSGGKILDTNLFIVVERPTLATVISAVDVSAINAKLTSIEGNVATIKTDIGIVKSSLSDIGAKLVSLDGDVATIDTVVGTIEGKVISIDGNVATISTDVGTVKLGMSDVKTAATGAKASVDSLMMVVYGAVILSLIAALAAVVCVIQINRKIAG